MQVAFRTPDKDFLLEDCHCVPRVGETVIINAVAFEVVRVVWKACSLGLEPYVHLEYSS